MAYNARNSSHTDWCSKDSSKEKEDPLALHNLPTAQASHHENVEQPPFEGEPNERNTSASSFTKTTTSSDLQKARGLLGLHPTAPINEEHDEAEHSDLFWPKIRIALKEPFAEFWGTFILVFFGDGSVAQVLLSTGESSAPGGNGFGNYQSINWGWGLGVMLGICTSISRPNGARH